MSLLSQIPKPSFIFDPSQANESRDALTQVRRIADQSGGGFTRGSSKYVVNKAGVLVEVPEGVPAVEFDGAFNKGYLAEPSATNLLTHPNKFDESVWAKNDCALSEVGAFGDIKAWEMKANSGTDIAPSLRRAFIAADNSNRTNRVVVKAGTHSRIQLSFGVGATTFSAAILIELSTGEVVGTRNDARSTLEGFQVKKLSSGWFLIEANSGAGTADPSDSSSRRNNLGIAIVSPTATSPTNSSDIPFNPTGDETIYVAATQAEIGLVGSSFVLPPFGTGGTSTRSADSLVFTGAQDLIGQTSGVMLVKSERNFLPQSARNVIFLLIATTGSANRITIDYATSGRIEFRTIVNNSTTHTYVHTSDLDTAIMALSYSQSKVAFYINGSKVFESLTPSINFTEILSRALIGTFTASGFEANATIKSAYLWNNADWITDELAKTLTRL